MAAAVTLRLNQGEYSEEEVVFNERTMCTLGRADDCVLQLPSDLMHQDISRHHCVFIVEPPEIRVRDLGSRNGTFVNGRKIGQRAKDQSPEQGAPDLPEQDLHDGDEVRVGHVLVGVRVSECVSGYEQETRGLRSESPFQELSACGGI